MVYRLFVETIEKNGEICWSYAYYNHQDFMVYKRFGKSQQTDVKKVILEVSLAALTYFERSIRRRYYDEHFSTRIDEDYVTLFTHYPKITEVAEEYKKHLSLDSVKENTDMWEALTPFFIQKTMMFENSVDEKFINIGKELAHQAL